MHPAPLHCSYQHEQVPPSPHKYTATTPNAAAATIRPVFAAPGQPPAEFRRLSRLGAALAAAEAAGRPAQGPTPPLPPGLLQQRPPIWQGSVPPWPRPRDSSSRTQQRLHRRVAQGVAAAIGSAPFGAASGTPLPTPSPSGAAPSSVRYASQYAGFSHDAGMLPSLPSRTAPATAVPRRTPAAQGGSSHSTASGTTATSVHSGTIVDQT